jgi:cytidylate kinase
MPAAAPPVVAIDGPAASGKGTLAKRIARELGFAHLDTGALYRGVGLIVLNQGGRPDDAAMAAAAAEALDPAVMISLLEDPRLRTDEIAQAASAVSVVPAVRSALLAFQRHFAEAPPAHAPGAVLDGRDIGTVVCPAAPAKLFVTASPEVRAKRRLKELHGRGQVAIYAHVLKDMKDRDERDSQRAVSPLRPAADAFLLDTSALDADQAFEAAMSFIRSLPAFVRLA